MHQLFNTLLQSDGFEIVEKTKISGKPIFSSRMVISNNIVTNRVNHEILVRLNAEYVTNQISIMENSIENSPYIAIGIAKELIETCCKQILLERKSDVDKKWDLPDLVKNTNKLLKLTPTDIPDQHQKFDVCKLYLLYLKCHLSFPPDL
jgi:hypothetical protein